MVKNQWLGNEGTYLALPFFACLKIENVPFPYFVTLKNTLALFPLSVAVVACLACYHSLFIIFRFSPCDGYPLPSIIF